jgi:NADPH:quinone reductase
VRAVTVKSPGKAEVLELVDSEAPSPGPGELTIDVAYAGVGFVDTLMRAGAFGLPMPFTPGLEVTGRVRATGEGVDGFEVGSPVAALLNDFGRGMRAGGYAEVAVAHSAMAVQLPEDADLALIAGVLINGVTAWMALHDLARLGTSDTVLVLGASGGLGGIAGRLAAAHPARRVIGVFGSEAKIPSGAPEWTHTVLGRDLATAVAGLTEGAGADLVIDPVGGELRTAAYEQLAPFGRLVVLGNASGQDPSMSGDSVWNGSRQILGLSLGTVAHLVPGQVAAALSAVVDLVHRAELPEPAPAVVPLEDAVSVHRALEDRVAPGKTVLSLRLD